MKIIQWECPEDGCDVGFTGPDALDKAFDHVMEEH